MVDHNVFENGISNGDTLSEGYFNGIYSSVKNVSSGHDHDGVNSKIISITANDNVIASAVKALALTRIAKYNLDDYMIVDGFTSELGTHYNTILVPTTSDGYPEYTSGDNKQKLICGPATTPWKTADFTGASMDSDYTISVSNGTTYTFDAANNEMDFTATASLYNLSFSIEYTGSTSSKGGMVIYKFRKNTGGTSTLFDPKLSWGGFPPNLTLVTGGNTGIALNNNDLIFIRYIRSGDHYRTDVNKNNAGWVTNNYGTYSSADGIGKPIFSHDRGMGTPEYSVSCYAIEHYNLEDGAYWISDAITPGTTLQRALLGLQKTTVTNSSITLQASADNGSNWQTVTENTFNNIINTGTTGRIKIIFNTNTTDEECVELNSVYGLFG